MLKWSNKNDWFLNTNSLNPYKLRISVTECSTAQLPWASLNDHRATVSSSSVPGRNKEMLQLTSAYINTGQTEHSNQLAVKLSVVPWRVTLKESILHFVVVENVRNVCAHVGSCLPSSLCISQISPVARWRNQSRKLKSVVTHRRRKWRQTFTVLFLSFKNCFTFSSTKEECVY